MIPGGNRNKYQAGDCKPQSLRKNVDQLLGQQDPPTLSWEAEPVSGAAERLTQHHFPVLRSRQRYAMRFRLLGTYLNI